MVGIVKDNEVVYVSKFEDFKDIIGVDIFNALENILSKEYYELLDVIAELDESNKYKSNLIDSLETRIEKLILENDNLKSTLKNKNGGVQNDF